MKRKTPIKHQVKSYTRKGKTVHTHLRGHGKHTSNHSKLSTPTLNKPKGYVITLIFDDKTREEQQVIATSYTRAIDEAFENKHDSRIPIEINVVDPSIGQIIHWAGDHARKYGEIAAKKSFEYGKRAAQTGVTMAKDQAKKQLSDYRAKQLIDKSYSPNRGTRTLARAELQRDYPHIWRTMDLSRS